MTDEQKSNLVNLRKEFLSYKCAQIHFTSPLTGAIGEYEDKVNVLIHCSDTYEVVVKKFEDGIEKASKLYDKYSVSDFLKSLG